MGKLVLAASIFGCILWGAFVSAQSGTDEVQNLTDRQAALEEVASW